jgi:hypothetical protein
MVKLGSSNETQNRQERNPTMFKLTQRLARALVLVCALLVVLVLAPGPVAADDDNGWTKTVEVFTFGMEVVNGCNDGEPVNITGEYLIVNKTRPGRNGGIDGKTTIRLDGAGVGVASGAEYRYDAVYREESFHTTSSYLSSVTQNGSVILKGQGVPDLKATYVYHLSFDAEGQLVSYIDEVSFDCIP